MRSTCRDWRDWCSSLSAWSRKLSSSPSGTMRMSSRLRWARVLRGVDSSGKLRRSMVAEVGGGWLGEEDGTGGVS